MFVYGLGVRKGVSSFTLSFRMRPEARPLVTLSPLCAPLVTVVIQTVTAD